MKTEIVTITPDMAVEFLKRNKENRKIREQTIKTYARDMRHGDWALTHQGIAFNDEGTLVDGQHRLNAIVIANVPVKMMVSYGIEAHQTIDTQIKRTATDINGINAVIVAVTKSLYEGTLSGRAKVTLSPSEINMYYLSDKDAIDFAVETLHTHKLGLRLAAIKAAMATAYHHEDHEMLKRFGEIFLSGTSTLPEDSAAVKLRDYIIFNGARSNGGNRSPRIIFIKTQQAIKRFCRREPILRFNLKNTDFEYPINVVE